MWNLIITLGVGIVIGILAIYTVRTHYHWLFDILVGLLGSFAGSYLLHREAFMLTEFSLPALLGALIGAVVFSLLVKVVFSCRSCLPTPTR